MAEAKTKLLPILIIVILLSFIAGTADSTIYAYTDPQGRVRITDIPEDGSKVVVLPRLNQSNSRSSLHQYRSSSGRIGSSGRNDPFLFRNYVKEAAELHNIPESLIYAVMKAESNFNPYAVSRAGAKGLMQLIPSTARLVGVYDLFNARENILGGTKYLKMMLNKFGRLDLALAAYNAGPQAVERYSGIPPYSETLNYVPQVMKFYREYGGSSGQLTLNYTPRSSSSSSSARNRSGRSNSSSTVSAGDVPVISKVNTPLFYYRGPDGQIYISNIR